MLEIIKDNQYLNDYHTNEAYKVLRTNVQFCGNDYKIIAVTSSTKDEGRSAVSFNLAVSMAESGKKVMYIDADLRKSTLMKRFDIKQDVKGFSQYLSGKNSFDDVVLETTIPNLHVVVSGPNPPNPAELLDSEKFQKLMPEIKDDYDYIIIDTPPLQNVIDGAIVARECDGVILVVQANSVSYKVSRNTVEQLKKSNCQILGAVLNEVNYKKSHYHRKYKGYYGSPENGRA